MIEQLSAEDVLRNVELSRSVGWHDAESEWRVLYQAALVLGVRQEGRLVAQGALGDYGAGAAALSKMIVAPALQRRGLGAKLLDGLLAVADERGSVVGLCATEQGRPLYASRGFAVTGELVILTGTPNLGTKLEGPTVPRLDAQSAVELDRRFTGCDRGRLLCARLREAKSAFLLAAPGEQGFGMATVQTPFSVVGPIMAETERGARTLAREIFCQLDGPLRIDVPVQHAAFRNWLVGLGLEERAQRVEMARGAERLPWQVVQRFALATQAWG